MEWGSSFDSRHIVTAGAFVSGENEQQHTKCDIDSDIGAAFAEICSNF
jgi:hypothetical protein